MRQVELFYVHTDDNIADILTKNLTLVKFKKFRDLLGITFLWISSFDHMLSL